MHVPEAPWRHADILTTVRESNWERHRSIFKVDFKEAVNYNGRGQNDLSRVQSDFTADVNFIVTDYFGRHTCCSTADSPHGPEKAVNASCGNGLHTQITASDHILCPGLGNFWWNWV